MRMNIILCIHTNAHTCISTTETLFKSRIIFGAHQNVLNLPYPYQCSHVIARDHCSTVPERHRPKYQNFGKHTDLSNLSDLWHCCSIGFEMGTIIPRIPEVGAGRYHTGIPEHETKCYRSLSYALTVTAYFETFTASKHYVKPRTERDDVST